MATVAAQRPISHHLHSDNKGWCRLCVVSDMEKGGGSASVCDSPEVAMTHPAGKKKTSSTFCKAAWVMGRRVKKKNKTKNELNVEQGEYGGGMARHVIPLQHCQISCINIDQFIFNRRLMSDQFIRAGDAEGDGEGLCLRAG